jgi:addiction module HigA family antidote
MKNPVHPGFIVKHDYLDSLGMTVTAAAEALGVSRPTLSNVLNGRAAISAEMAIRLEKAGWGTADMWLRMQMAYDLAEARRHEDKIKVQRIGREPVAKPAEQPIRTMNLKDLQSQIADANRTARMMKEVAGVLDPHPGVRQAFEEMNRVRTHLAGASAHLSHLTQLAFPPNRWAEELAESVSMMTARIKPIMDAMPRLGLDLPELRMIQGLDIGVASSFAQLQQAVDYMPRLDPPASEILRSLDQVPAIALPPLLREPEWLQALHSAAAAVFADTIGFPDALADDFAGLVEREFAAASVEVTANVGTLEAATVLEFALTLLRRLDDLGRHPLVQQLIIVILAAIVAEIVGVEWQVYRTPRALQTTMPVVDEGKQPPLPQIRGDVSSRAHVREHPDRTSGSFGVLAPGDEVLILGREGDWLRVMVGLPGDELQVGWVYARLVKALIP